MALSGLDIFKLLPKTNCGDCGVPTCLAFAMKLAQKQAELDQCPHASEEAQSTLGAASEPPMRTVKIGAGESSFKIGGETEMFRHEKTFYHETAIFIDIQDTNETTTIEAQVKEADGYLIERVGENLQLNGFCISNSSRDPDSYLVALDAVLANTSKPLLFNCSDPSTMRLALAKLKDRRPLINPNGAEAKEFIELAKEAEATLVVSSDSLDDLAKQTEAIVQSGFKDLVLNLTTGGLGHQLQNNSILRRSALRKGFKPFGFPIITFVQEQDEHELLADAAVNLCKYAGIVVLPHFNPELVLTLYALRQNIYTDPQKPIQVEPKVYPIGEPRPDSPVFVTTNFSLTYFIVSGEIENSGHSAWLVVPDCEGMSVLTAWAAGKFNGETIAKFVKEIDLANQVTGRELIIPGLVASISGELEEALPGWNITVGPQEAADLGPFINHHLAE